MMTKLCVYQKMWFRLKTELSGHFMPLAHQSLEGRQKIQREDLRKDFWKSLVNYGHSPKFNWNHFCCTGNGTVGRKGQGSSNTELGVCILSVQGGTECGYNPQNQATQIKGAVELHPKCLACSTLICTVLQSRSSGPSETNYFLVDKCISVAWSSIQHLSPKHLESYYNPHELFLF